VRVHATLVKRGQAVAYCSLDDVPACRVLEVPLWMVDVAACCKIRRKVKILEHAETMGDWPTRFERPWQDVTRQFWTRVTLCSSPFLVAPRTTVQPATMIGFKQIEFFDHTGHS